MSGCPDCGRDSGLTMEPTGETVLVAKPLGTFSLAGAQMKVSAAGSPRFALPASSAPGPPSVTSTG